MILNMLYLTGGALKYIGYPELRKCILRCDTSILTENLLQSLIQVCIKKSYFPFQIPVVF